MNEDDIQFDKIGPLEAALKITDRSSGESIVVVTTPSAWSRADDFCDVLRAGGQHTEEWVVRKIVPTIAMIAAKHEGIFNFDAITLSTIADFSNRFEVADVLPPLPGDSSEESSEESNDPFGLGQEDDLGTQEETS